MVYRHSDEVLNTSEMLHSPSVSVCVCVLNVIRYKWGNKSGSWGLIIIEYRRVDLFILQSIKEDRTHFGTNSKMCRYSNVSDRQLT